MSDVGSSFFEPWPSDVDVHVEWGPHGARLAGDRGDVVVIVDVLSFSTSVVRAVALGAIALSYSAAEIDAMGGRNAVATNLNAQIVSKDRAAAGQLSLSPASLSALGHGDRLIFTSLNGAACVTAAANAPLVIIGALTNRTGVGVAVRNALTHKVAGRCTIVACGERWTSTTNEPDALRPGVEDHIGAGAIVAALADLHTSPEADVAAASFTTNVHRIPQVLRSCVSGRELIERGFPDDVELAAIVDCTATVPLWRPTNSSREFSTS